MYEKIIIIIISRLLGKQNYLDAMTWELIYKSLVKNFMQIE